MSHFSFIDTVKAAMKRHEDKKKSAEDNGDSGNAQEDSEEEATHGRDSNSSTSSRRSSFTSMFGRGKRASPDDLLSSSAVDVKTPKADGALALLMDSARARFVRRGLVGTITIEQLMGIATLQVTCDVDQDDVDSHEMSVQRGKRKEWAMKGETEGLGGGEEQRNGEDDDAGDIGGLAQRRAGVCAAGEVELPCATAGEEAEGEAEAEGEGEGEGEEAAPAPSRALRPSLVDDYDPDADEVDPLLLQAEKRFTGQAADALNAVEHIIRALVRRSEDWEGRPYSDKLTLMRSVSVGFYLPVFMTVGFMITVEITASVSSLVRYRRRVAEVGLYRKALRYIDEGMVEEIMQQGFGQRLAIKAVLATHGESLEAALHWAIHSAEARMHKPEEKR